MMTYSKCNGSQLMGSEAPGSAAWDRAGQRGQLEEAGEERHSGPGFILRISGVRRPKLEFNLPLSCCAPSGKSVTSLNTFTVYKIERKNRAPKGLVWEGGGME